MGKALIWSDLHLHSHKKNINRLDDCIQVLHWAFSEAKKNKCQDVFFLGDLFHERSKIDMLNYLHAFDAFVNFSNECPEITVWLLVGNHDMYHKDKWDVNSIRPFDTISNVRIIETPQRLDIQGVDVDFLPHTENPLKELEHFKIFDTTKKHLLLAHLAVNGASLNTLYGTRADVIVEYDEQMVPVNPESFDVWDQTFLGHYHGAQELNNKVEYVGSPLQLSYGEAFQEKHLIVFDMETFKKTYIINDFSPQHLILPPSQIDEYDVEKNFVRIILNNTDNKEMVDIKNKLGAKKAADISFQNKEKKQEDDAIDIENAKAILYKSDEMLEEYINSVGVPTGLDKDKLIKIGNSILEKGANNE